jgi:adenylate kinase
MILLQRVHRLSRLGPNLKLNLYSYSAYSTNSNIRSRLVVPLSTPASTSTSTLDSQKQQHVYYATRNFSRQKAGKTKEQRISDADSDVSPTLSLDREACYDLFEEFAVERDGELCLDCHDIRKLLVGIGEEPKSETIRQLFEVADEDGNGLIDVEEFIEHADTFMGGNPARIILVVGGPGSGKGVLSKRLEAECNVVHLSSGDLLRCEVSRDTALGRQVRDIMSRGELVSSAIMVALMKKRMRDHPGKRVLLDGFPRSLENAHDLVTLCGKPELALHLQCDDTFLMERIMGRGATSRKVGEVVRDDDNFETGLQRLRTYHKYHHVTMDWLREQHVPIVNLDCSGSAESVWEQLKAIGRLMRPAVKSRNANRLNDDGESSDREDWSGDPSRTSLF